jgi:hypothetical protein
MASYMYTEEVTKLLQKERLPMGAALFDSLTTTKRSARKLCLIPPFDAYLPSS